MKLQKHIRFLYSKGGLYKVYNGNLLLHGCIPMAPDGTQLSFSLGGKKRSGRAFLDYAEAVARQGTTPSPAATSGSSEWTSCGFSGPGATPPPSDGTG